jgi:hypothetical protein
MSPFLGHEQIVPYGAERVGSQTLCRVTHGEPGSLVGVPHDVEAR